MTTHPITKPEPGMDATDTILEYDEPPLCRSCEGQGSIYVKRNSRGEVDYIDGNPTNETARCDMCHGEGVEQ